MNPLHKTEEEKLLALFRRVWGSAGEIASAEIGDRPDVRGMLASGRPFGMEIATLTEDGRAQSDEALKGSFARELAAACAAAGLHATFSLGVGDWQANRLVDKEHRARVVALLVQLTREAGGRRLDLQERALDRRQIDAFNGVTIEPVLEGFEVWFGRSSWGLPGPDFVRERIARKDERAETYRETIGADADLWLLLVVGTTLAASVIRPSPIETFETRFDRVFFLECWKDIEKVTELTIRRRE
jgi:hypothetical protein